MKAGLAAVVASIVVLAAGACAPVKERPSARPVERATEKEPYDFRTEGVVPAFVPDEVPNEPDIQELPVSENPLEVTEAEVRVDSARVAARLAARADSTAAGFRIQVFATANREVAESARSAAEERLGTKAYVDEEGGMFKVRVGDYVRREDAEAMLASARKSYYRDAWIAACPVVVPRASQAR